MKQLDGNGTFSEVVALIQRNEEAVRSPHDVEHDLQRVLLMARDAKLRDQMVQFQAVRRITTIWANASAVTTQRYCAGILGNLAQSERGRLSASSCDRWNCVSHRHHCPLFLLLSTAQCSPDTALQHVAAAALLAFSIQNECQIQIDAISGIPTLLRLVESRDADVCVYAAATMWNICKSPLLLLKLETTHGILKDQLARRLTDILAIPLEPFHLVARPTGERGTTGIIESDSPENLNLLISCSISTDLRVVLHVENYTGHTRSLMDQFQSFSGRKQRTKQHSSLQQQQQSKSLAHFDESGVLVARTCAVCTKRIKVTRKAARGTFLLCAKDDCGQTYHVKCSRWSRLDEDDVHPEHFHCDQCMLQYPLVYWDFVAEHPQHSALVSELRFKSVAIHRVPPPAANGVDDACAYAMLFNRKHELVGVGAKRFRVPRSSKDDEMFIVWVQFVTVAAYPATYCTGVATAVAQSDARTGHSPDTEALACDWQVSFASDDAHDVAFKAGCALLWPSSYLLDVAPLVYASRSLRELESAWMYEFQGEQPTDRAFSFGASRASRSTEPSTTSGTGDTPRGLWATLYPRKGVCAKALAAQVGRAKQLADASPRDGSSSVAAPLTSPAAAAAAAVAKPTSASGRSRHKKPHFPGKKLNRVAIAASD